MTENELNNNEPDLMADNNPDEPYATGNVVEGTITNITNFGAFMRIDDKMEGLIHISEVANEFVTDINRYVKVGEKIKVRIMGVGKNNKLELSIKRTKKAEKKAALFIHNRTKNVTFEEKLTKFLKRSEEKQIDIRRNLKVKQGVGKKRK
jgi:S1 RNA binding domain protein